MALELRGTNLRHFIIGEARKRDFISIAEVIRAAEEQGFSFSGRPSKAVSDALRWETRRNRMRKLDRGEYRIGCIPPTSEKRIDERLRLLKVAVGRGMTLDDLKSNPGYFIPTGAEDDEEW
ncbi:hypothetical protein [Smaragdicoccus niigatensis]|uniref:hypothetical protein n=1 Tax=Smaragdicoccus niigatensis TaxID=359359 RepID=UPI0003686849|nr:hypothetical protein [Smaragdicoccus niigatensis]